MRPILLAGFACIPLACGPPNSGADTTPTPLGYDASQATVTPTGSATSKTLGDWMDWVNNRTPAEGAAEVFLHSDPSTAGFEGFDQIHMSFENPGGGVGTMNHGVWTGWNAGQHTGGTNVVAGKPALIMGFEDNYFDAGGDNAFGMEWYVEYWSPDGTSVQMFRPLYTRVLSGDNLKHGAVVVSDIGDDGAGMFAIRSGTSAYNLFFVDGTLGFFRNPFTFLDTTEAANSSSAALAVKGGVWVDKSLMAGGTQIAGNKIAASSVGAGAFSFDTVADRLALGILTALPTSSTGSYLGWANGIAGTLVGDLVLVPRTDAGGTARFYAGSGTPTEKASVGPNGLTIGAASTGTAISASIRATGTLPTATIPAGTTNSVTITVMGAAVGAEVAVGGPSTLEAGLILYGYVSAANTVTLRIANVSAGSITPAGSQTVSARVFNP